MADALHMLDIEAGSIQPPKHESRLLMALGTVGLAALNYAIARYMAQGSLVLSLTYSAAMTVSVLWSQIRYKNCAFNLQKRLPLSGILEKIAIGPQEVAKIYDYTPWPWSLLILGPRPRYLSGWIKLIARNLDWYLAEPKLLIRLESVGYVLSWVLYFGFMLQNITAPMDARSTIGIALMLVLPAGLFSGFGTYRRMMGAALLRDYLKELVSSDKAE